MSTPHNPLVRAELQHLLQASTAFGALAPAAQRSLSDGLERVGSYLADPAWLEPRGEPEPKAISTLRRRVSPPMATALAQGTGGDFQQGGTREAPEAFARLTQSVDFPAFVSSLIRGVFQAIVDSSIEQMRAYQELVASLVQSLNEFEQGVSDSETSSYLTGQFPGAFRMGSAGLEMQGDKSALSAMGGQLGLGAGFNFSGGGAMQEVMLAGRRRLAQQRQKMLATMAMMGINRIVVTDGRINAKVLFEMSASDDAKAQSSVSSQVDSARTHTQSKRSAWGTSRSNDTSTVKTKVRTAASASSESQLQLNASLSGEVGLNFRSETVDLNKLAAQQDMQSIEERARPTPMGAAPPARPNDPQ